MLLKRRTFPKDRFGVVLLLTISALLVTSCESDQTTFPTGSGEIKPTSTLASDPRNYSTDALIYDGPGAAPADVNALLGIVKDLGLTYSLVNADDLNSMSLDDIAKYGLIVWPGGYAGTATKALKPETRTRVRQAVVEKGVSYIGFCAGAFMAASPPAANGGHPEYGFSIVPYESILPEYEPNGKHQHDYAQIVTVSLPDNPRMDLVWLGGPYFPSATEVLARYKTGAPAMMQTAAGRGFVVLTGPHPESPSGWADGFADADGKKGDVELAAKMEV